MIGENDPIGYNGIERKSCSYNVLIDNDVNVTDFIFSQNRLTSNCLRVLWSHSHQIDAPQIRKKKKQYYYIRRTAPETDEQHRNVGLIKVWINCIHVKPICSWDSKREWDIERESNVNMIAPPRRIYCKLILNAEWKISLGIVCLKSVLTSTRQCAKRVPGRKLAAEIRGHPFKTTHLVDVARHSIFPHFHMRDVSARAKQTRNPGEERKIELKWTKLGILRRVCEKMLDRQTGGQAERTQAQNASALTCGKVHLKRPCLIATYLLDRVCRFSIFFFFHSKTKNDCRHNTNNIGISVCTLENCWRTVWLGRRANTISLLSLFQHWPLSAQTSVKSFSRI